MILQHQMGPQVIEDHLHKVYRETPPEEEGGAAGDGGTAPANWSVPRAPAALRKMTARSAIGRARRAIRYRLVD